jgi:plastocyanin
MGKSVKKPKSKQGGTSPSPLVAAKLRRASPHRALPARVWIAGHPFLFRCLGAALLCTFGSPLAHAAPVRGIVRLPAESVEPTGGLWRVENGILPVRPRIPSPQAEVVVLFESRGATKATAADAPVVMELHGSRLDPSTVIVPPGGTVEFKNSDRVGHTLHLDGSALMPPAATPAGQVRVQRFETVGIYHLKDDDVPHIKGQVVVTATPYAQRLDELGAFHLDLPEGAYTLKVLFRGLFVLSQPLDVTAHTPNVAIQIPSDRDAQRGAGR